MIQANELRIGNATSKGVIKSILENGVHFGFGKCSTFSNLEPIPLTEEILLKFGAIKQTVVLKYGRFILRLKKDYNYWHVTDLETMGYLSKIEFVHEWQNFVFVMNGEELTINL